MIILCLASKSEPYVCCIFVDVRLLKVSMTIEFNLKALEIDFKNLKQLSEYFLPLMKRKLTPLPAGRGVNLRFIKGRKNWREHLILAYYSKRNFSRKKQDNELL